MRCHRDYAENWNKETANWGTLILSQCSTKAHSLVDKQVINGT